MTTVLLLLLTYTDGHSPISSHRVDVVEVNTTYREDEWQEGVINEVDTYVIWWNWSPGDRRYQLVDWRYYAQCGLAEKTPRGWEMLVDYDDRGIQDQLIRVSAKVYWRTWTMYDPERLDWNRWRHVRRKLK